MLYTIICFINSLLVIKYKLYGNEDCDFAMGFPFMVFAAFVIIIQIIGSIYIYKQGMWLGIDSEYVKENYPDIWKRTVPFWAGGSLFGGWFGSHMAFIRGKYDDGTDERLNLIKNEVKTNQNLIGGAFLTLLFIEFVNMLLIARCM